MGHPVYVSHSQFKKYKIFVDEILQQHRAVQFITLQLPVSMDVIRVNINRYTSMPQCTECQDVYTLKISQIHSIVQYYRCYRSSNKINITFSYV
jgi:hypothetical protein